MPLTSTLALNQKQTIEAVPKDAAGNVALIDAPPTYVSADPTIADVFDDFDGVRHHYWIRARKVGATVVTVTALQNAVPATDTVSVTVTPDPITDMGITLGTPVTQ